MCFGTIARVLETWDAGARRTGRLEDGAIVSLAFVPDAEPGDHVLVHLGVPVEKLGPAEAAEALSLRALDTGGAP
jgi:hydrogenase expression/formation protein HypC